MYTNFLEPLEYSSIKKDAKYAYSIDLYLIQQQ